MGPIREERLLTTHITVSLLKAWKVTIGPTVVGIEVQPCRLSTSLQEGPHQELIFFSEFSASKMANCIIVDIVNYLMLLLENS